MKFHKLHPSAVEIVSIIFNKVILIIGKLIRIKLNGVEKLVFNLNKNKLLKYKNFTINVNYFCKNRLFGMGSILSLLDKLSKKLTLSKISILRVVKSFKIQNNNSQKLDH